MTLLNPAYARVREAIDSGQLQPNEHLVEADLCAAFGVGRAAIRTALALLEQDGLVVREPNRGARVRLITVAEAIEILEARTVLEGVAARHAALKARPRDIQDLRRILDEMRGLLEKGDLLGLSNTNDVLHARLIAIADHQTITRLIAMLRSQTVRFQYRTILVRGRSEAAFAEHSAIVDAIEARDPDRAEQSMRRHVDSVRATLQDDGAVAIDSYKT